jgi:regulator of RNase E activity RraA
MSGIGFRIFPIEKRVSKEVVEQFREIPTPFISDNMNRIHAVGSNLTPYHKSGKLVGTALTVKTRPGDNLMVHKAIDLAEPGDVIVVDAGGDTTNAIVGEIMLKLAKKRGISGFVIDGAIRDSDAFKNDTFPIYAKGVTHRGPYKDGPGEINTPISIDGMLIHPGDLVVGDDDGIAVIPREEADEILKRAHAQGEREAAIMRAIEDETIDRTWIDKTLEEKGCEFISGKKHEKSSPI